MQNVIAGHDADFQASLAARAGERGRHCFSASFRIHAAGVRDYLYLALDNLLGAAFDHLRKIASVPGLRIARVLLFENRHGDLGQIVEGQVVDRPAAELFERRFERVAPKALGIGDADHRLRGIPSHEA